MTSITKEELSDYLYTKAKVIEDSVCISGHRVTTMQVTCPRFIWSEVLTHRVFSRSAQSSRAVPVNKMIDQVETNPVVPLRFANNISGMQSGDPLTGEDLSDAIGIWKSSATEAAKMARVLTGMNVSKEVANRILEPYLTISAIITSTEWDNFFSLRICEMAQPEIHSLALKMREARSSSTPRLLNSDEWHTPYITKEERETLSSDKVVLASAARCARVSFVNHDKTACDLQRDLKLSEMLIESRHASPFEHVARPYCEEIRGNLRGWASYRSDLRI